MNDRDKKNSKMKNKKMQKISVKPKRNLFGSLVMIVLTTRQRNSNTIKASIGCTVKRKRLLTLALLIKDK
jgi:hypothetical protein